jgi:putative endonuclease
MPKQPHIYIMTNRAKGTIYTGVTSDLPQRIQQHQAPDNKSFTGKYGLTQLVYYEPHKNMIEAIKREKAIKKWRRAWKVKLIESINPDWNDLSGGKSFFVMIPTGNNC